MPDWLFWVWVGLKAAVPIIAAFVMYRIGLREAEARRRSALAVHLTYILILLLVAPLSVMGFEFLLSKPEAPAGAVQDLICVLQLMMGGVIFWLIRGGEFVRKTVWPPRRMAEPSAAPHGGPATPLGSSGVAEGPPSVS